MRPMGCCGAGLDWVVWGGEIVPNYALTLADFSASAPVFLHLDGYIY